MFINRPISVYMWIEGLLEVTFLLVRGYHGYKSAWLPAVARETLRLTTELTNPEDPFAVAVLKYSCVVGHTPRIVSQTVSFFLGKYTSVYFHEVIGAMVNSATGFGLEIPCLPHKYSMFTSSLATRPTYRGSRTFCCSRELYFMTTTFNMQL